MFFVQLRNTPKNAIALVAALAMTSTFAMNIQPESISLKPGDSKTVQFTEVSGSITVAKQTGTANVQVVKTGDKTFRVQAVTAGYTVVEFKDRVSLVKLKVTVNTPATGSVNSAEGRLLASNCFQCHGTNGSGGFDKLAGKSASEIYKELKGFATGKEDPGGIMAAHAMGFTDAQMQSIATYFSNQR